MPASDTPGETPTRGVAAGSGLESDDPDADSTSAQETLVQLTTDLREVLTPVLGYLELIGDESTTSSQEQQRDWLAKIEQRLAELAPVSQQISESCARLRRSLDEGGYR
jgi:hypothetical protein